MKIKERINEILDSSCFNREEKARQLFKLLDKKEDENEIYVPGYWEPEEDEEYWTIADNAEILKDQWENLDIDTTRLLMGMVFKTKAEAEHHLEYLEAYKKYVLTIARLNKENDDWKVDWEDNNQSKYRCYYNFHDKELSFSCNSIFMCVDDREYFCQETEAQLIEELGEELTILAVTGKKIKN